MSLNVRAKSTKLLEENIGANPHDLTVGKDLLGHTKTLIIEGKRTVHWTSVKLKNLCLQDFLWRK